MRWTKPSRPARRTPRTGGLPRLRWRRALCVPPGQGGMGTRRAKRHTGAHGYALWKLTGTAEGSVDGTLCEPVRRGRRVRAPSRSGADQCARHRADRGGGDGRRQRPGTQLVGDSRVTISAHAASSPHTLQTSIQDDLHLAAGAATRRGRPAPLVVGFKWSVSWCANLVPTPSCGPH